MKSVIFICLLSLTVCFSLPSPQDAGGAALPPNTPPEAPVHPGTGKDQPPAAPTTDPHGKEEKNTPKPETPPVIHETTTKHSEVPAPHEAPAKDGSPPTDTPQPNQTINKTTPPSKPEDKKDKDVPKVDDKTTEVPKTKTTTETPAPGNKNNGTKPDDKDDKTKTTTQKNEVVSTEAPKVVHASRSFDGPSFIGGIILTLGLLAIGFMGFKYYKNQTERNYHTL